MSRDRLILILALATIALQLYALGHSIHTDGWLDGYRSCREALT